MTGNLPQTLLGYCEQWAMALILLLMLISGVSRIVVVEVESYLDFLRNQKLVHGSNKSPKK